MAKTTISLAGTRSDSFIIGKDGPVVRQGSGAPSGGNRADLYIRTDTPDLIQNVSGRWKRLIRDGSSSATIGNIVIPDVFRDRANPTGFVNGGRSSLRMTDGTRTFSISTTGSFAVYVEGVKYQFRRTQSVVIAATEGLHYIYFDDTGTLQETTRFRRTNFFKSGAMVGTVYWDRSNRIHRFLCDGRHYLTMDGDTKTYLRTMFGTNWVRGLALSGMTVDGDGTANGQAELALDNGSVLMADLSIAITNGSPQTLRTVARVPVFYLSGSAADWRMKTATSYPFVYRGTAGYTGANGRIPYNQNNAGTWELTEIGEDECICVHLFARTDIEHPVRAIQGQRVYRTLALAQAGADTELESLITAGLPFTDMTALATIIVQSSARFTNTPKAIIRSTRNGADFVDWRGARLIPQATGARHSLLSNLSHDDHLQYALLAGRAGGQTLIGGTARGESLTLQRTSNATRGRIDFDRFAQFRRSGHFQINRTFQIQADDGSASLPGYAFQTDTNTGIYRIGSDRIGIRTGGANRISVGPGLQVGSPTGGDQGAGTVNATGLYVNGAAVVTGGGSNTYTALQTFRTTGTGQVITAVSTDAGASEFTAISVYRNRASPAANDVLGSYRIDGNTRTGVRQSYVDLIGVIEDPTNTGQRGHLEIWTQRAGTLGARLIVGQGIYTPSQTDKGTGTINANEIYVGGTAVLTGNQSITLSGDIRGTGSTSIRTTLATVNRDVGSYSKVTVNAKGLVTAATAIDQSDVTTALGYTPVDPGRATSYSALQTFRTTGTGQVITTQRTDAGATEFTAISVYRNRASPAARDVIGSYLFEGQNRRSARKTFGRIRTVIDSPTARSEDGHLELSAVAAGTLTTVLKLGPGVQVGSPTGGDQGGGTLNAVGLYVGGTAVLTGNQSITLSGDIRGTGSTSIRTTLATVNRNVGTFSKVTVNGKGLVTAATAIDRSDVTTALGYTPVDPARTTTYTALQTFRTTGTGTVITAESTDAGATEFTAISVYRNRASPAARDVIGSYLFEGQNRRSARKTFGRIRTVIDSPTARSEDGHLELSAVAAGTVNTVARFGPGLTVGSPTGGDQGSGTINAEALYVNGTEVVTTRGGVFRVAWTVRLSRNGTTTCGSSIPANAVILGVWVNVGTADSRATLEVLDNSAGNTLVAIGEDNPGVTGLYQAFVYVSNSTSVTPEAIVRGTAGTSGATATVRVMYAT